MSTENQDLIDSDYLDESDVLALLFSYQRKRSVENLTGPILALVIHSIFLTLMFVFIIQPERPHTDVFAMFIGQVKPVEVPPLGTVVKWRDDDGPIITGGCGEIDRGPDWPLRNDDYEFGAEDAIDYEITPNVQFQIPISNLICPLEPIFTGCPTIICDPSVSWWRKRMLKNGGAEYGVLSSLPKALTWLAHVQDETGSWGNGSLAHSGMALMTFLGHGETPLSRRFGETVTKAMRWLMDQTINSDDNSVRDAYAHGIATTALAESYGMTGLPHLRYAMEKAVQVILDGQQDGGGFDHGYAKGARSDFEVSAWQMQALRATHVAGASNEGLADALGKSAVFLRKAAFATHTILDRASASREILPGARLLGLQLAGAGNTMEARLRMKTIMGDRLDRYITVLRDPSKWNAVAAASLKGWYFDTQAVFNNQGKDWEKWRAVFQKVLVKAQHNEGYWDTAKEGGTKRSQADRIMSTCWAALQLEVFFKRRSTYNRAVRRRAYSVPEMVSLDDEFNDVDDLDVMIVYAGDD